MANDSQASLQKGGPSVEKLTCGSNKPNPVPISHDPPLSTQPYPKPEVPTAAVHLIPSPRDVGAPQEWASLMA